MDLVVLAGDPCSGKTTAADALGHAGYPVVSMGGTLRESFEESSEDEVWQEAQRLREEHGPHGVAVPCGDKLEQTDSDVAVLEGSRNPAEASYLAGRLGAEITIIWVEAPDEARERWFAGREGRGQDPEMLEERTRREREAGMGEYEKYADHEIQNNGTQAELSEKVAALVS